MSDALNQFVELLKTMPLSKKISMVFIIILLFAGFALMFFWANRVDYRVLYKGLSPEDAGTIVTKLKEENVPYKLEAGGTMVLVPADKVLDLRLNLAAEGLPMGGNVGFEIFDNTDFRTTQFVQELNYRRALQGELSRTINQFDEVKNSRVFIVLPKDSVFVEDSKPASASIQLELKSGLQSGRLAAIIHLVASAVEGLESGHVTVVDTKGRVIFKGGDSGNESAMLSSTQLDYQSKVEGEIRKNVQSMLEGIVGLGRAIVRVNADIDFNRITSSEEEYDPDTTAVRSTRGIEEAANTGVEDSESQSEINQRRGIVNPPAGTKASNTKRDVATNYEINKITRTILKPAGSIKRLSVAAVIDGNYKEEQQEDGTINKKYIPRSEEELAKFEDIVMRAMGFSEDREDQVSVSSMPFIESMSTNTAPETEPEGFDILKILREYKGTIINLVLAALVFFLVIRPLMNSIKKAVENASERSQDTALIATGGGTQLVEEGKTHQERALELSKNNPEKTSQLLKGWIGEQ